MHRFLGLLIGALLALFMSACGPPWQVVRQVVPNPMLGKGQFAVLPIDFSGLRVGDGSEADYLADKDGESRSNWSGDKVGMNDEFQKALMGGAHERGVRVVAANQAAPFAVHAKVTWIEPGFYAVVASRPSEVEMVVTIATPEGNVLDEITLKHSTGADITNPAVGNRLRDDAEALGDYVARYLETRVKGVE